MGHSRDSQKGAIDAHGMADMNKMKSMPMKGMKPSAGKSKNLGMEHESDSMSKNAGGAPFKKKK